MQGHDLLSARAGPQQKNQTNDALMISHRSPAQPSPAQPADWLHASSHLSRVIPSPPPHHTTLHCSFYPICWHIGCSSLNTAGAILDPRFARMSTSVLQLSRNCSFRRPRPAAGGHTAAVCMSRRTREYLDI